MSLNTVFLASLGCAKNQVDSEGMIARLVGAGSVVVDQPEAADVILVNTCTFVEAATQESIDTILELAEQKKAGRCRRIVVAGCLAQRYAGQLRELMPEVDVVLGVAALDGVVDACCAVAPDAVVVPAADEAPLDGLPRAGLARGPSAYLKIAEGCSRTCAFCIIPQLRGPLRSRPIAEIVREAEALAASGARELILVAQDTTAYGRDRGGRSQLPALLEALDGVAGVDWVRVLYAYPAHFSTRLMETIADLPRVVPYVDVPLQHVDSGVLRAMGRWTSERTVRALVARLRARIPGLTLRTTMLVGFPGETEAAFRKLLDFVAEARFERLGAFAYSPEEGTPAALLPRQIPDAVRQERLDELMALQLEIHEAHNRALVGTRLPVLVEGLRDELLLVGRHAGQAPEVDGDTILDGVAEPGELLEVELTGVDGVDLVGRPTGRRWRGPAG